jgi:hypothetical protein
MKRFALFMILCGFSAAVVADDAAPYYVGLGLGHVSVDKGSLSLTGGQNGYINGTGTAIDLFGGYEFDEHFGVELGYHDYGNPTATRQSGFALTQCPMSFSCPKVSGITLEGLGRMELVPDLEGILRLGVLAWNVGSPGSTVLPETSGNAFIYGIGVRHRFDYGLSVDVTYERSNFTTEETRIGLSYSF